MARGSETGVIFGPDSNFITGTEPHPCFICGLPTNQIEVNFEAPLHRECEAQADADYWRAVAE